MLHKVTLGQIFLPSIVVFPCRYHSTVIFPLLGRQAVEAWEPAKSSAFLDIGDLRTW